jgi:hypothetical protein
MKLNRFKQPKKKTFVLIAVAVGVLCAISLGLHLLSTPSTGTVTKSDDAASKPAVPVETSQNLTGKHFTLAYNSTYKDVNNISDQDKSALEQYRLIAKAGGTVSAAVSVHPLPAGGLAEDSGYIYRVRHPDLYAETKEHHGTVDATIMRSTDGNEATAFIVRGPYLATISVTSANLTTTANDALVALLSNYSWTGQ